MAAIAVVIAALPAQVPAGLQFAELGKRQLPADSDKARVVVAGDVDGDGDLDMVVGNYTAQIRLYLNDGTGTFSDATAGRMPVVTDTTNAVALGDIDGDGDLDLVIGNGTPFGLAQQNRLYWNNGTGTFSDVTSSRMPVDNDLTTSLALGDVNGDGRLDIVLGNSYPYGFGVGRQSRLYLNNGSGGFSDATAGRMPANSDLAQSVALGDIDGDGDLDLAIGNRGQNRLYRNDGTGTFTDVTATQLPVDNDNTRSVTLGDVDGDSDLDLVIGNRGQNRLYRNNGTGTFSDATAGRMPVEFDLTNSVALGDVDGDGDLDQLIGNEPGQNRLCVNDGTGTFSDATVGRLPVDRDDAISLALGDVDGDGDLDLVMGNLDQQHRLYRNNGTGTFSDATAGRLPVISDPTRSLVLGDVDGDGDLDLVIGNLNQQNRLYLNNGTGTFSDVTASRMPVDSNLTHAVALGDVDGDGDLDMVMGNSDFIMFGLQSRLYINNGTGTFSDATAGQMPTDTGGTQSVALGDIDGDGDLDLAMGRSSVTVTSTATVFGGLQNLLYLNNGTGTFSNVTASRMPAVSDPTTSLALGDVDDDGDLDMVIGNASLPGQRSRLYLNNGAGTFSDASPSRLPVINDDTRSMALGDVDGDGDLDMVFGNTGSPSQQDRLYINLQRQLDARYLLRAGKPYTLDVYSRYGPPSQSDVAFPFLSTTRLSIPIPPLGILGIDPMQDLPLVQIPQPAGVGTVTWTVPNNPAFAGIEIYAQALILQSTIQQRLTNVTADVIIR